MEAETEQKSPKRSGCWQSQRVFLSGEARTGALLQEGPLRHAEAVRASRARAESSSGAWLLALQAAAASLHGPVSGVLTSPLASADLSSWACGYPGTEHPRPNSSCGAPGLTVPSASGPPSLGPSTHFSQQVPDTVPGLQKALTLPASEGQFSRLRLPGVTPETSAYVGRPHPAHRAKSMSGKLTCRCWKGTERKGN